MDCSGKYTFFLLLLVVGCYIHSGSGAYDLLLSCGNSVVSGSDCTMTCDTKTTTETVIQWLNGSTATVIDKNVDCTDGGGLPYESSCNTPGKFDLKITNAQYGRDSYAWSCTSPFGGGVQSNATDGNTFVTVPLTSVTLTRSSEGTSISCVAVCSPSATVTLYEGSPPSQDTVIVTESSFTKTTEGLETSLTSTVDESKTYYCHADNGVDAPVNSAPSVSDPVTTTGSSTSTTESSNSTSTTESSNSPSSTISSNSPSTENTSSTTQGNNSEFACEDNCVEEARRIYLFVFVPVSVPVAIVSVFIVSVVCRSRTEYE